MKNAEEELVQAFENLQPVVVGGGQAEHPLSEREVEVLCCVAQAMTAKNVALVLSISVKTVDRHKANIMLKLKLHSQVELTRYAIRNGFVEA